MALSVRVHSRPPLSPVPTVGAWLSCVPRRRRTTVASPALAVVCALYAYAAAISLTPRLLRRWDRQLHMCLPMCTHTRISLARPPATRAVSNPFGRPNVYVFGALRLSSTLLPSRAIMCTDSNPFSKLLVTNISNFENFVPYIISNSLFISV